MVVEDNLFVLGGFNILLVLFEVFSQFTLYWCTHSSLDTIILSSKVIFEEIHESTWLIQYIIYI
jgi:hypothetical protein